MSGITAYLSIRTLSVNGLKSPVKTNSLDEKTRANHLLPTRKPLQWQRWKQLVSRDKEGYFLGTVGNKCLSFIPLRLWCSYIEAQMLWEIRWTCVIIWRDREQEPDQS
jgi:hypothetical protein